MEFKKYDEIVKAYNERKANEVGSNEQSGTAATTKKPSKKDELISKQAKQKAQIGLETKLTSAQIKMMDAEEAFENVVAGEHITNGPGPRNGERKTIDEAAMALKEATDTFDFYSDLYKQVFGGI